MALPADSYAFRFGNIDIDLRGKLDNTYDDNITYLPNDEKADFYTTPSVGLGAKYEGKRLSFDISGDFNQDVFYTYHKFDNMSENAALNLLYELSSHDTLTLIDSFTHDYDARSFEAAFGRTSGRYSYYWNNLDLTMTHEITKQFSLAARFADYVSLYDRSGLSNSVYNKFGGLFQYYLSSITMFFGSYDYSVRTFSTGGSPSSNVFALGLRQYFTKKLYLEGQGGIELIKPFGGGDETRPYYMVSLIGDLDENTRASLSYLKEDYTTTYSKDLFSYWRFSGDFSRKLLERLWLSLSAFYGNGEYKVVTTKEKYTGASLGLTYDITKDIQGSINYTYSQTDSNVDANDYTKNVIRLRIKMEF